MTNNTEKIEAQQAIDALAREVHGIYGQHAAEAGLRTPKWEDLPEPAKGISRDISRLVLLKMQEAYTEGTKLGNAEKAATKLEKAVEAVEKPSLLVPLPKSWSAKEAIEFVAGAKPHIEEVINKIITDKRSSPVGAGLNNAISKVAEKITLDVVTENPEILAKLREIIESNLTDSLFGDHENKED